MIRGRVHSPLYSCIYSEIKRITKLLIARATAIKINLVGNRREHPSESRRRAWLKKKEENSEVNCFIIISSATPRRSSPDIWNHETGRHIIKLRNNKSSFTRVGVSKRIPSFPLLFQARANVRLVAGIIRTAKKETWSLARAKRGEERGKRDVEEGTRCKESSFALFRVMKQICKTT